MFDVAGLPLSAQSWEKQMQWIVDDADRHKGVVMLTFNIILNIIHQEKFVALKVHDRASRHFFAEI